MIQPLVRYVGNRNASISDTITSGGVAQNINGKTLTFKMRPIASSTLKVNAAATNLDDGTEANRGKWRYDPAAADVDTEGFFLAWVEVAGSGLTQDVPEFLIQFIAHSPQSTWYTQVEEFKQSLTLSGTTFANMDIETAVAAASRKIDEETGRRFYTTTSNEVRYFTPDSWTTSYRYIDGDVAGYYTRPELDVGDIAALTEVVADTNDDGTFEQTWVVDVDFRLEPYNAPLDGQPWDRIVLTSSGGRSFPGYDHSIRVTGRFGWLSAPPQIKLATEMLAGRYLKRLREAPFGVAGIGADGDAVRIASVDPDIAQLIAPFVRRQILV